jgi:hypothetical protein
MVFTPEEIVTLVKPVHPEKAWSPMLATLAGIVTLVSSVQPANADCPMPVTALPSTEEGIVIAPANPALPVIETVPSGFVVVAYPVTRMRVDADADV